MNIAEQLYEGRPGFAFPYEGPTKPEGEKPEWWDDAGLEDRLAHTLKDFDDQEAEVGRVEDD